MNTEIISEKIPLLKYPTKEDRGYGIKLINIIESHLGSMLLFNISHVSLNVRIKCYYFLDEESDTIARKEILKNSNKKFTHREININIVYTWKYLSLKKVISSIINDKEKMNIILNQSHEFFSTGKEKLDTITILVNER